MAKIKLALKYLYPSLLALVLVIADIEISRRISDNYYATHNSCGPGAPSPLITIVLGLASIATSIYVAVNAFKAHHKWIGAIAVLLALLVIFGGLLAWLALTFVLCF